MRKRGRKERAASGRNAGHGRVVPVLTGLLALLLCFSGCGGERAGGKLKVAVDIFPLADFCRRVGGEHVEVEVLVPPGASPHTYELTSGQMKYLSEADLVVVNGLGLTPWAEEVMARAGNPNARFLKAGEAVPVSRLLPAAGGVEDGGQGEESGRVEEVYDPHVWLDPQLAAFMVRSVEEALAGIDPGHAASYRAGAERFLEELEELDREIAETTASFARREFISFHSTWTYFARRYDLRQVGLIEEQPGKEPSLGEIASLVDLAQSRGVTAIFAEPQFNPRVAEAVAEESGGRVGVWILDPLGDPADPEKDSYPSLMRHNLRVMGEALD